MKRPDTPIRVLLVEDEPVCLQTMKTILLLNKMAVTAFPDAEQGLKALSSLSPHVVLTDIRLPGMDGLEFLRRVHDVDTDLPVILITGHSSLESAIEAIQQGARDYLLKPMSSPSALVHPVRKAAEHYQLLARNRGLQADLAESERLFRELFQNAGDALFLTATTAGGAPGAIREVNATACRMLDRERASLLRESVGSLLAPEQRAPALRQFRLLAREQGVTFESIALARRGRRIPVEIIARRFRAKNRNAILTVMRDISGRRGIERRIADMIEQERQTLGHELHDVLGQDLASIAMLASTLARGASSLPPDARHDARMIHDLSVRSAAFCRRLYSGLMPVELDRQGLCGALDHLAASTSSGFRVSCAFRNGLHADITSSAVKLHAYRIAQEAVANAIRHADATKIRIAIAGQRGNIVMSVEDNGAGIRPGKRRTGMGLHIMNNRARMIGGVLDVVPGRHGGTRVVCTWRNT